MRPSFKKGVAACQPWPNVFEREVVAKMRPKLQRDNRAVCLHLRQYAP
jgi:hypothetical protein